MTFNLLNQYSRFYKSIRQSKYFFLILFLIIIAGLTLTVSLYPEEKRQQVEDNYYELRLQDKSSCGSTYYNDKNCFGNCVKGSKCRQLEALPDLYQCCFK